MAREQAIRRLGAKINDKAQSQRVMLRLGTVASIDAAAGTDGQDVVTVSVNGSETPAPHLASYSDYGIGDTVAVLLVDASPLVLGRVAGLPDILVRGRRSWR